MEEQKRDQKLLEERIKKNTQGIITIATKLELHETKLTKKNGGIETRAETFQKNK